MDRLGLGADACRAVNERLVYASISGFGQTGPSRGRTAYDLILQGVSGMMSVTGPDGYACALASGDAMASAAARSTHANI
jgi:crotonobetainyl-CoA:carnitine CoA-transferase CaiB-like acyl-CoA transferase